MAMAMATNTVLMASDATSSTVSSPLSTPPDSPPTSPLTEFSTSPSPPPQDRLYKREPYSHLPTPPASQQTSQNGSPMPDCVDSGVTTDKEGPPPTKRRRISRERTTEYLDLRSSEVDPDQQAELDRLLLVLHKRQKIVVIAGAGISVSAGIPDFRSSNGLFRSLKDEHKLKGSGKHLFDASVYKDDNSTSSFHDMVSSLSRLTRDAKPTAFHHMLATIAKEDRLLRLYSQNVDGIDTSLDPLRTRVPLTKDEGGKWPRTVQLHGGLDKMVCSKCHELSNFDADLFSGPMPPLCPRCEEINDIRTIHEGKRSHGIGKLRPRMVLYNEHNPDDVAIGTVTRDDLRRRPDAVIVVGTTLKVPGVRRIVREMCGVVRDRRDGEAIWINNDLPPVAKDLEDCFDIIVQSPCDEVAHRAAMRKWYEPTEPEQYLEISEEDVQRASTKQGEVHVRLPETELSPTLCALPYANLEKLPSPDHINNSFLPPSVERTPRKPLSAPQDWSPCSSAKPRVMASIEDPEIVGDTIVVGNSDPGTPTKSQKHPAVSKISLTDRLSGKANAMPGKSKKPRAGNVKPRKSLSAKAATKPSASPLNGGVFSSFKTSKPVARDDQKTLMSKSSNLCHVLNASEPRHLLSQDVLPSTADNPSFSEAVWKVRTDDDRRTSLPVVPSL